MLRPLAIVLMVAAATPTSAGMLAIPPADIAGPTNTLPPLDRRCDAAQLQQTGSSAASAVQIAEPSSFWIFVGAIVLALIIGRNVEIR